jgi:zinc protease
MTSKSGALTALVNDNRAISTELLPVYLRGNVAIYCAHGVVAYDGDQAALRRDLEAVFEHYARAGLTADEVQAARTLELVVYRLDEADPAGMAGLWRSQVGQYGFHTPDAYINLFAAVTPAEVDRVARTWFVPHNMVSVETVFGAPKVVTPEVASQSREEAPPLPDWAHAAATSTANGFRPPQPMQTTLPNGIRVIAIDRPSSGIVQVYGHVQVYPPLATAPGLEGVDQVLAALFPYGPSTMSPAAFARALDAIGGHESAGQGFQLAVLPGDLDRGLRLLAANEINPTFDAVAFERAQATARERTSAMVVSLAAAAFKWVMRHLYPPGDPSQRIPTPDSIAALTVDDVRAYFAAAFRPERTTIVISGDVTPRRAIDAVARAFGGWTSSTVPAAPLDFPSVSPNTARTSYLPTPDLPLQIGFMGQTLDVSPASADYESLTAGFYVLGGSHGWLARDVVDAGLGMQATLTAEIGRQRSDLIIAYACAPQNAGRVHSIILADISRLQQRPLSAAELAAVKAQLVRRQILEADEDETLAQSYFALVDNGLPLEELARRAERYAALTPADIQNAMVRHVRRNGFVDLIVGPHVPL